MERDDILSNIRLVGLDLLEVLRTIFLRQAALPDAMNQSQAVEEQRVAGMSVAAFM